MAGNIFGKICLQGPEIEYTESARRSRCASLFIFDLEDLAGSLVMIAYIIQPHLPDETQRKKLQKLRFHVPYLQRLSSTTSGCRYCEPSASSSPIPRCSSRTGYSAHRSSVTDCSSSYRTESCPRDVGGARPSRTWHSTRRSPRRIRIHLRQAKSRATEATARTSSLDLVVRHDKS